MGALSGRDQEREKEEREIRRERGEREGVQRERESGSV